MGREFLLKGDTINGEFLYEIEDVSGTGASCIVYKAWYKEDNNSDPHWVQLKELYPYDIGLFRDASNNLICKTEEDKKKFDEHKKNFEASNNMLVKLNSLTDSTSREIQSFPYNGTKYSIVAYSNGKQYSEKELQKMELNKLLGIIESLAISVNRLHEEGYLHLDIKPDNFLINDIGSAILFDVDSVVPVDEIKYRNGISYSKKWAAPEVKQAAKKSDYKDISCKSDIFSIGVILFEAIMGRDFLPMETVSYNRNWDVENSIKAREEKQNRKVNINPKFYHKIKEIFEKTLDRNPDKRYQTAKELYDDLDKARDLLKENPWIIPSFRTVTKQFTGRKRELAKMNSILQKENTMFLHGFGGIGKSELALKYAEVYKDNFDTIVFCKYENIIKEALLNIQIANFENDSNTMYLRKVAELCDERTLIILDNFDVETDADDYLDEFINNYHCKKIITTRTDFSKLYTQLDVDALEQDDAILLFEKESKWVPKAEDEEKTLNEILKLIGYHTYFTVILAKKKEMFSLSIDELRKQTEEMLLKKSGKLTVAKDGKLTTDTIDAIAAKLFDFNSITESQKQTLRNLYMLCWRTVSRNDYTEIAGYSMNDEEKDELIDSLNDLTRLGWVLYNEKENDFFLHPIMQELIKNKLGVNVEKITNLLDYYRDLMATFFNGDKINQKFVYNGQLTKQIFYIYSHNIKELVALCNILLNADNENLVYITNNLLRYISCGSFHKNGTIPNAVIISKLMAKLLKNICQGKHMKEYYKLISKQLVFDLTFGNIVYAKDIKGNEIHIFKWGMLDEAFDYDNIVQITYGVMSLDEYVKLCLSYYDEICVNFNEDSEYMDMFLSAVYPYLNLLIEDMDSRINKEHFLNSDTQKLWDILRDDFNDEHISSCEKTANEYLNENKNETQLYEIEEYEGYSKEFFKYLEIILNEDVNLYELLESIEKNQTLSMPEKTDLKVEVCGVCFEDVEKNARLIIKLLENSHFNCLSVADKSDEYNDWSKEAYLLLAYSYVDEKKFLIYAKKIFEIIDSIPYKDIFNCFLDIRGMIDDLYYVFSNENKVGEIFDLICNYITDIIDFFEKKGINVFDLYARLSKFVDRIYIETNDEKYREMSNDYKSKMNELSDINYKIKD